MLCGSSRSSLYCRKAGTIKDKEEYVYLLISAYKFSQCSSRVLKQQEPLGEKCSFRFYISFHFQHNEFCVFALSSLTKYSYLKAGLLLSKLRKKGRRPTFDRGEAIRAMENVFLFILTNFVMTLKHYLVINKF